MFNSDSAAALRFLTSAIDAQEEPCNFHTLMDLYHVMWLDEGRKSGVSADSASVDHSGSTALLEAIVAGTRFLGAYMEEHNVALQVPVAFEQMTLEDEMARLRGLANGQSQA